MYDMSALYQAQSVQDAIRLRLEHPEAQIIAGGTDVLVQMREGKRAGKALISIQGCREMRGVSLDEEENLRIGSLTTFSHITADPLIQRYINVLGEAVDMVGGPQIRNAGTIGGNTCNGVTSADSASTLHAWEAIVEITGKNGVRRVPIKDFYLKAGAVDLRAEEGEIQTVETLIKCIVIASGNDASVAMAEFIGGDEGTFVKMMNERAKGLGMEHTKFIDCCGLTDSPEHVTTARDIALMSRELITKYPQITNYTTIWMENITHVTKQGTKEFGLSNTNKLLKMATNFEVTGLKTGSTSIAKYCLSATAKKDGVELIAAIMAAPDYKARFKDAVTLLNYGFGNCRLYKDETPPELPKLSVTGGKEPEVELSYGETFTYLGLHGEDFSGVERELMLEESAKAPVKAGDQLGTLHYRFNGEEIGNIPVIADRDVDPAGFSDYVKWMMGWWRMRGEEV